MAKLFADQKSKRKKQKSRFTGPLCIALLVMASLGATFYFVFLYTPSSSDKKIFPASSSLSAKVQFEELQPADTTIPSTKAESHTVPSEIKALPRTKPIISIIIDDMGYRKEIGDKILKLTMNLSFSFLPFGQHTASQTHLAQKLGKDILLHLPMEPTSNKWDPGPGTLYTSMSPQKLQQTFQKDLAAVPMAIGINNHMGSKYTEDKIAMQKLLKLIQSKKLFFLDSLTSGKSLGYTLAKELGVKTMKRNVFLDNDKEKDKILKQLDALLKVAEKKGKAVGLAHPHKETLLALMEFQKYYNERVDLVGIRTLVEVDE